jgi:hypothetical protein
MRRNAFPLAIVALAVAVVSAPAKLMIAMKPPAQRAVSAEAVVVGKVTSIEKEPIEASPFIGAPNKVPYKVAVVQIEKTLFGAKNLTHIKVGFIPPPPPPPPGGPQPAVRPPIRRGNVLPELKEGQEWVFFLTKHPDGSFFIMPNMSPPLDVKGEDTKKDLESIQKVLKIVEDPMKALKAEKAEDRGFAASVLASKYRSYPETGGEVDQVPINAEESKLILKALAEADWTKFDRAAPNGMQSFYSLALTDKDGWVPPKPVPVKPGEPPVNFNLVVKDAFEKWLVGPGKDYVIKQIVPKKR